jgi:hypothetical protein
MEGSDSYQFGGAVARVVCILCPLFLVIAAVAVSWWAIDHARRSAPARPSGYRDPAYPPWPSETQPPVDPPNPEP